MPRHLGMLLLLTAMLLTAASIWWWRDRWPGSRPSLSPQEAVDARLRDHRVPAGSPPCDSVESLVGALRRGRVISVFLDYQDFAAGGVDRAALSEPFPPVLTANRRATEILRDAQVRLRERVPFGWHWFEGVLMLTTAQTAAERSGRRSVEGFLVDDVIGPSTLIERAYRAARAPSAVAGADEARLLADIAEAAGVTEWPRRSVRPFEGQMVSGNPAVVRDFNGRFHLVVAHDAVTHRRIARALWRWRVEALAIDLLTVNLVGVGLVLSSRAAFGWHRRRARRSQGLCPACGYDLRATPRECPECGASVGS